MPLECDSSALPSELQPRVAPRSRETFSSWGWRESRSPNLRAGKSLAESSIASRTGLIVIAVQDQGTIVPNPPATTSLPAGGELLMLGTAAQRLHFSRMSPEPGRKSRKRVAP